MTTNENKQGDTTTVKDEIKRLRTIADQLRSQSEEVIRRSDQLTRRAGQLTHLVALYPGLKKYTRKYTNQESKPCQDRWFQWSQDIFYTSEVNAKVCEFDMLFSCGCCCDSPLEIWTFLMTPNGRVYSDPPYCCIGKRSKDYATLLKGWQNRLRNSNIPGDVITLIEREISSLSEKGYL